MLPIYIHARDNILYILKSVYLSFLKINIQILTGIIDDYAVIVNHVNNYRLILFLMTARAYRTQHGLKGYMVTSQMK